MFCVILYIMISSIVLPLPGHGSCLFSAQRGATEQTWTMANLCHQLFYRSCAKAVSGRLRPLSLILNITTPRELLQQYAYFHLIIVKCNIISCRTLYPNLFLCEVLSFEKYTSFVCQIQIQSTKLSKYQDKFRFLAYCYCYRRVFKKELEISH